MQITALETIRISERPNLLWLHVHTDEGLVGLGDTFRSAVRDPLRSGEHVLEIRWPDVHARVRLLPSPTLAESESWRGRSSRPPRQAT